MSHVQSLCGGHTCPVQRLRAPAIHRSSLQHKSCSAPLRSNAQPRSSSQLHRKPVVQCRAAESATDPSAGQISQELIQRMEGTLREELEADRVAVTDVYGDGRHVSIDVVSKLFEGQPSVKRQRMVYKAIWQELQNTVHAVDAMVTKTPAEIAS